MFGLLFSCTVNMPNNNQNGNEGGGGQTDPEPSPGPIVDNNETPTIYLAGDSTVKTYNDSQFIGGWGQYLDLFLEHEQERAFLMDRITDTILNCRSLGKTFSRR